MRACFALVLALVAACGSSSSSPHPDAGYVACNARWGVGSSAICDPVCNTAAAIGSGATCNVMQRYVGPCNAAVFDLDGKRVCCADNGTSVWIVPLPCIQ